tara:strand:- start:259 stop:2541 length:2283 start_codon:yes stop_codon:yes gene_type:complete
MSENDWRKYAAGTYPDQDVEKAFLDQAYVFIQNKATPLMRDPYRLGFEIVFKNDDNSRMVGIFVFRVDSDLLYAPVFFLNGQINGTDLLYRHNTKKFVPLNNDWCQYLISLSNYSEGTKSPKDVRSNNKGMNVQELVTPPAYKSASVKEIWEDMQKVAAEDGEKGSIVKNFIMEDGGYSAVDLLTKKAGSDPKYATHLARHVGIENVMPAELNEETKNKPGVVKQELTYQHGFFGEKYASQGGMLTDTRKNLVTKIVTNEGGEEEGKCYGGVRPRWEHGCYELLHKDGTSGSYKIATIEDSDDVIVLSDDGWQQVPATSISVVGHEKEAGLLRALGFGGGDPESNARDFLDADIMDHVKYGPERIKEFGWDTREGIADSFQKDWLDSDNTTAEFMEENGLSKDQMVEIIENMIAEGLAKQEEKSAGSSEEEEPHMKEGSWYTQVLSTDENLKVTEPFQVVEAMDTLSDGVERYKVKGASGKADWLTFRDDEEKYFLQLPQGNDEFKLLDNSNFDQLAKGANLAKVTVAPRGLYYIVQSQEGVSGEMSKLASQLYVMAKFRMDETTAGNIMEKAASGRFTFYYEPIEKKATNLSFEQPPEFYTGFDPDFNMPMEEPQKVTVISDSDEPQDPAQRIGDGMKFDDGAQVGNMNADSLAQLSMDTGKSSLFEHGVVGNLVDTYDSTMLIDKYIPVMEEGLDKIGRILFLFYWKPNDFSRLYGSDDQSGIENKLISNFKSFGDLVLELLKKTKFNSAGIALSANN